MARIELAAQPEGLILSNTEGVFGPANGATANIYEHGTGSPVSVYAKEVGGGVLSQPLTASSEGLLPGWVDEAQRLDVVATYKGVTAPTRELIAPFLVSGESGLHHNEDAEHNIAIGSTLPHLTTGKQNTYLGNLAGDATTTGSYNTGFGKEALAGNTIGYGNVAIGNNAMVRNTEGVFNTAVGYEALGHNTSGYSNTAIGSTALEENTTGSDNTAVGISAMEKNTIGTKNTAVGVGALEKGTESEENVALGEHAFYNFNGPRGVAIGYEALVLCTTGEHNIGIGYNALGKVTTGAENVALGYKAGFKASVGSSGNVFLGAEAGPAAEAAISNKLYIHNGPSAEPLIWGDFAERKLTINGSLSAPGLILGTNQNTAVGLAALADTTGTGNVAVGGSAGASITTGTYNVAFGFQALLGPGEAGKPGTGEVTGSENVAIGREAMKGKQVPASVMTASANVVIGYEAFTKATTGSVNVAIGKFALINGESAEANVVIGNAAGAALTAGSANVFIGTEAGRETTGSSNVFIGPSAGEHQKAVSNKLFIANSNTAEPLIWGDFSAKELCFYATKQGFFGAAPVARPAKGAETTAAIWAALKELGLTS